MRTIDDFLAEQNEIAEAISEQFPEYANRLRITGQDILSMMKYIGHAMNEADRLRISSTNRADRLDNELEACARQHERNAGKLRHALGHWSYDIPGGFVATVCYHIISMKRGIKELLLNNVITMSRGAEILGLPLSDVRRWANSGFFVPGDKDNAA